jgi:hypothetical protein
MTSEKITIDIPPWTKTANDLGNKIKISHLTCPKDKRKETAREHTISVRSQSSDQTILTIYTDGSKMEKGTGAGYIAYHRNRVITKKEIGMGSQAEAFDAEKWALAKCIHWATKHADCKGNLTNLRRKLHLSLAKGNPK